MKQTIITEQFASNLEKRVDDNRCGFCHDREQGTHGEIKREWSPTWNMFISFCRKHSPEAQS